jgi:hypothetical protein
MTFTFNGTAVYIYGAKRSNHGTYSGKRFFRNNKAVLANLTVSLDGGDPLLQLGRTDPRTIQALLYEQQDLDPNREHIVVVTNLPSRTDRSSVYRILYQPFRDR